MFKQWESPKLEFERLINEMKKPRLEVWQIVLIFVGFVSLVVGLVFVIKRLVERRDEEEIWLEDEEEYDDYFDPHFDERNTKDKKKQEKLQKKIRQLENKLEAMRKELEPCDCLSFEDMDDDSGDLFFIDETEDEDADL